MKHFARCAFGIEAIGIGLAIVTVRVKSGGDENSRRQSAQIRRIDRPEQRRKAVLRLAEVHVEIVQDVRFRENWRMGVGFQTGKLEPGIRCRIDQAFGI